MAPSVPPRLSLVTLGTRDVPALRAFYERLGWVSKSPPGDEFAAFPLGGAVLGLYKLENLIDDSGLEAPAGDWGGYSLSINVDQEGEVAAVLEAVEGAGGTIHTEPVKADWGGVSAYFADPEGNVWEVAWLPEAEFDERGALIWPY